MRLQAIGEIHRASGKSRATGEIDAHGEPIYLIIPEIIEPMTIFDASEEEGAWYIANQAARPVTRAEERLAADLATIGPDEEEEPLDGLTMMTRAGPSPRDAVAEALAEEAEEYDDLL